MRKINFILLVMMVTALFLGCAGNNKKYHNGPVFIGEGGIQTKIQNVHDTSTVWLNNPKLINLEVFRANPLYQMAKDMRPSAVIPHSKAGEIIEYFMGDKIQCLALGENPLAAKREAKLRLRSYFLLNAAPLLGFREIACQPSTKVPGLWVSYCEAPIKINKKQAKNQYSLSSHR